MHTQKKETHPLWTQVHFGYSENVANSKLVFYDSYAMKTQLKCKKACAYFIWDCLLHHLKHDHTLIQAEKKSFTHISQSSLCCSNLVPQNKVKNSWWRDIFIKLTL